MIEDPASVSCLYKCQPRDGLFETAHGYGYRATWSIYVYFIYEFHSADISPEAKVSQLFKGSRKKKQSFILGSRLSMDSNCIMSYFIDIVLSRKGVQFFRELS